MMFVGEMQRRGTPCASASRIHADHAHSYPPPRARRCPSRSPKRSIWWTTSRPSRSTSPRPATARSPGSRPSITPRKLAQKIEYVGSNNGGRRGARDTRRLVCQCLWSSTNTGSLVHARTHSLIFIHPYIFICPHKHTYMYIHKARIPSDLRSDEASHPCTCPCSLGDAPQRASTAQTWSLRPSLKRLCRSHLSPPQLPGLHRAVCRGVCACMCVTVHKKLVCMSMCMSVRALHSLRLSAPSCTGAADYVYPLFSVPRPSELCVCVLLLVD